MNGASFEATVVNGQIQLPANVHLPENSRVLIVVPAESSASTGRVQSPRLARPEQAVDFEMDVRDLPHASV